MPREEMKSRLGLDTKTFNLIVEQAQQENSVAITGPVLHAPHFAIVFTPEQQAAIEEMFLDMVSELEAILGVVPKKTVDHRGRLGLVVAADVFVDVPHGDFAIPAHEFETCAGQTFASELTGSEALQRRPMDRVIEPLRQMGADIRGVEEDSRSGLTLPCWTSME